jgi:hypothetical protein
MTSRTTRRLLTLALISGAALFSSVPGASAGILVASATNCADQSLAQEFLPWADVANYTVAPGGDFEPGSNWALSDGAGVVSGNEPFYVGSPSDSRSLTLADGASATSPSICVGIEHPDIRFFARSSNPTATLRVQVLFEDAAGNVQTSPMGSVTAGSSWSPSAPLPIVVNLLPLLPGSRTAVAFRLSAAGGSFQVDDVYVDPYRSR